MEQPIKDYYSTCYGIRVIDNMEVSEFFDALDMQLSAAEKCLESSIKSVKKVVAGKHHFTEKFLRLENSFFEIASAISAMGYSIEREGVVRMFGDIIEAKTKLTLETGAWEQYTHLANWLIYIASILEIEGTSIETIFLKAVKRSMDSMSKDMAYGYSWHAYNAWSAKWGGIIANNRKLIRKYIEEQAGSSDALLIVGRG